MKLKLHWGIGIAVFYISFVLILVGIILYSLTQRTDLVSKDYYQKELSYQQKIDKMNRTKKLAEKLTITQNQGMIILQFPKSMQGNSIKGTIEMFRPSDASLDRSFKINLNDNNFQIIEKNGLNKGLWRIKIDWNCADSAYYNEESLKLE